MFFGWLVAAKISLEKEVFSYFFQYYLPSLCLTSSIALGTLRMISNDEWECLQAISAPSTPFNAPLAPTVVHRTHMLG